MKTLFFLLMLIQATQVTASDKLYCSLYNAFKYKDAVTKLRNDKQMHCSMSCLIARKCKTLEVVAIGFIKEFVDALGYGTPDPYDIKANLEGISIAKKGASEKSCYDKCIKLYPEIK
ncbi:MAG: hypothetical protein KC493_03840 [Bacteriovoracaceae bacterium]|nr:hypothetical protein [Bacteriovoracaceae bacterium]